MSVRESEFRTYPYIQDRLAEMGWNTKSPKHGGQVYTQNEATLQNNKLKEAFGKGRPEYVVAVRNNDFWVIEAKADNKALPKAIKQAQERAKQINGVNGIGCRLITGFAGTPETTHYIETHCLVDGKWESLVINNRTSTGFISLEQAQAVLDGGQGRLDDYEVSDALFKSKSEIINEILHNGAINKRNRAGVLSCILLALANDQNMQLSDNLSTLIKDINTRAKVELSNHGKGNFYTEIEIKPPSSNNHIKIKEALTRSIEILRDINIASTIGSGRDVLGHFYEQFLKYANDAKEIGIALTPRHITNFGAEVIDVRKEDIVFDPTCGTGGFLVAALDKVRRDGADIDDFKRGNLYGVEQDPFIATLAIVNMVFRGDGSSNIKEGDCLTTEIATKVHKVLMNPPFALDEKEWEFVDKALDQMHKGGLLFAVLPANTMNSLTNGREEITWRENLLRRHTLISVIKLPDGLFYPQVSKGTYGVLIKAHHPHQINKDKLLWAVLEDGMVRTKTQRANISNIEQMIQKVRNYIATKTEPDYMPGEMDCSLIEQDAMLDLSPENYIGKNRTSGEFSIQDVQANIKDAHQYLNRYKRQNKPICSQSCMDFPLKQFLTMEKGRSGQQKEMRGGGGGATTDYRISIQ